MDLVLSNTEPIHIEHPQMEFRRNTNIADVESLVHSLGNPILENIYSK